MPSNLITLLISGYAPVKAGDLITVWADWVEVDVYIAGKLAITRVLPEEQRMNPEEKYGYLDFYNNEKIEQHYKIMGKIIEYNRAFRFQNPVQSSLLENRFLDYLQITLNGWILLEVIEIIPLDEEQTLDPDAMKKCMEEKWQKTEAEREI